jgi:hypothetical protein
MKRPRIQPHEEDATLGLDKDPSIHSPATVENKAYIPLFQKLSTQHSDFKWRIHGVFILGESLLVGSESTNVQHVKSLNLYN